MQLDHHLEINDEARIACRRCGHAFCGVDENVKDAAVCKIRPIEDANPLIVDPKLFIDDEIVFRQYFCPGCAVLLENDVVLASSETVWDKQLQSVNVGAATAR